MNNKNLLMFVRRSIVACAVTPFEDDLTLYKHIDALINKGIQYFLFNADNEHGLRFARQVLLRKKKQTGNKADRIFLIAVTCDENAVSDKEESFRDEYYEILSLCDDFIDIKSAEPHACEKFMLSKSSHTI